MTKGKEGEEKKPGGDLFLDSDNGKDGGYEAKGVYRPMIDCMMKTFDGNIFCPVCSKAIQDMIDFYAE